MRVRSVVPLVVGLLPLLAAPANAEDPQLSKRLVQKVFSVADLVTPIPDLATPSPLAAWKKPTTVESGEQLVRLVTSAVRRYSWDVMGGPGKVEFHETGCALTVTNTADVVAEVANLLEALQRMQDVSVCTEVRILRVPTGLWAKAGVKPEGALTEREVETLLAAVQTERDAGVTQCPKVTTFDGQVATVRCSESRTFVTGVEATKVNGKAVLVPKNTEVALGDTITLCGRVSADGQFVSLRANVTRTQLVGEIELLPVVTQVVPVPEGGGRGKPVPFTQFIQAPDIKTYTAEKSMVVPSGGTVVLGGWKETVTESSAAPAALSRIPYVNRLYKNVRLTEYDVVVLATTRVLRTEPAAVAPMPRAASDVAPEAVKPRAYRLKRAAANEVAAAVTKFLEGKQSDARVAFDVSSNTVFVQAAPAIQDDIEKLIRAVDDEAAGQSVGNEVRLFQLRNGAAKDVADAITKHLEGKKSDAKVVCKAASNQLIVRAERRSEYEEIARMIAAMDAAPPQVVVQALVMKAPAGFLSDAGLAADGNALVLSPREVQMLVAHIRKDKQGGGIDILSRPQLQMMDNQTGFVQVGGQQAVVTSVEITAGPNGPVVTPKATNLDSGLRLGITPRVNPDGEVLLRAEGSWSAGYQGPLTPVTLPPAATGLKEPVTFHLATGGVNVQSFTTTAKLREGHTVVVRGGKCDLPACVGDHPVAAMVKRCLQGDGELLVILTPHIVRAGPVVPAAHTEPAAKPAPPVMPPLGYGRNGSEPYPDR